MVALKLAVALHTPTLTRVGVVGVATGQAEHRRAETSSEPAKALSERAREVLPLERSPRHAIASVASRPKGRLASGATLNQIFYGKIGASKHDTYLIY